MTMFKLGEDGSTQIEESEEERRQALYNKYDICAPVRGAAKRKGGTVRGGGCGGGKKKRGAAVCECERDPAEQAGEGDSSRGWYRFLCL